jgi:hypothetical protein
VARNTIPNISKSVSQADNQLHNRIQGYITYIEEGNGLHTFLLKIMTDSKYYLHVPTQKKSHLKYTNMGNLHKGEAYSKIRPFSLKNITNTINGIFKTGK